LKVAARKGHRGLSNGPIIESSSRHRGPRKKKKKQATIIRITAMQTNCGAGKEGPFLP
jgi:hypothetical protein